METRPDNSNQGPKRRGKSCLLWILWLGIVLIAFVAGDYMVEDIWGIYSWSKAKKELQAAGISTNPKDYIPAPVPDSQNLAALPLFRYELDPKGEIEFPNFNQAFSPLLDHEAYSREEASRSGMLPYLGSLSRGEKPDMTVVRNRLAELCRAVTPPIEGVESARTSELLGLLYPALPKIRAAARAYPLCQFKVTYGDPEEISRTASLSTNLISFAKALQFEGRLAIYDDNPDLALKDFETTEKVAASMAGQPLLISGLVCQSITTIELEPIQEGLYEHVWNDEQLAKIDDNLGKSEFLSNAQYWLRGDFAVGTIPLMETIRKDRSYQFRLARKFAEQSGSPLDRSTEWRLGTYYYLWSDGTFDSYLAAAARSVIAATTRMLDPASHRVNREEIKTKEPNPGDNQYIYTPGSSDDPMVRAVREFAYAQAHVDETRIACRLERYRVLHGRYPDSLDTLVQTYGSTLPHDVMSGTDYHYKITGKDRYMIYSVGWNLTDDGGNGGQFGPLDKSPDWVWTNYPDREKPVRK